MRELKNKKYLCQEVLMKQWIDKNQIDVINIETTNEGFTVWYWNEKGLDDEN